jgi:hypothetical protein
MTAQALAILLASPLPNSRRIFMKYIVIPLVFIASVSFGQSTAKLTAKGMANAIRIVSAKYQEHVDSTKHVSVVTVQAVAEFSNFCHVPRSDEEVVKAEIFGQDQSWTLFVTHQEKVRRGCPSYHSPVQVEIDLGFVPVPEFEPGHVTPITVNGVRAVLAP